MNALTDYRRDYAATAVEELDEADLAAILPRLRILDRSMNRLANGCDRIMDAVIESKLESLDRKLCRLVGSSGQLQRRLRQILEDAADPDGAATRKHRVPRVMKNLTAPGDGAALIREAGAAIRSGTFDRWLARNPNYEAWERNRRAEAAR